MSRTELLRISVTYFRGEDEEEKFTELEIDINPFPCPYQSQVSLSLILRVASILKCNIDFMGEMCFFQTNNMIESWIKGSMKLWRLKYLKSANSVDRNIALASERKRVEGGIWGDSSNSVSSRNVNFNSLREI